MLRRFACFLFILVVAVGLSGCGGGLASVEGVVTLDGQPVEGASVSFAPQDDTGKPASGATDAQGRFKLSTAGKPGAENGTYKVVVTKVDTTAGTATLKPGDPEYTKMMAKGLPKPGPASSPTGPKSLLPAIYGSTDTTPLKQKIPPDSSPIKLELKSKQ
jgi:hypothetical protein